MSKITGRLFVKEEGESDSTYREWNTLSQKEKDEISVILNRTVAESVGQIEKVKEIL